jgi:hypothetical protein
LGPCRGSSRWNTKNYNTSEFQIVTAPDAAAMSLAIRRVYSDPKMCLDQDLTSGSPWRATVDGFLAFCDGGSFEIQ